MAIPIRPLSRCFESGKICYDKRGAQTVKNEQHQKGYDVVRIYQCPACDYWHLTSRPDRTVRIKRNNHAS